MMDRPKLTGATRYRSQRRFGGREELVLQVEVRGLVDILMAPVVECEWRNWWRDATTGDVTASPHELPALGVGGSKAD